MSKVKINNEGDWSRTVIYSFYDCETETACEISVFTDAIIIKMTVNGLPNDPVEATLPGDVSSFLKCLENDTHGPL